MAVIWQDERMVERVTFDGQRQRDALERFQERTELDATAIARAVGLSYPQYNRYRWGRLPLRTDQIPVFAAAYGVTTAELTQALGLMDDTPASLPALPATAPAGAAWTIRDALRGHIPEYLIDEIVEEREHDPLADQQAAVIDILRVYREVQAEANAAMLERLRHRDRPA